MEEVKITDIRIPFGRLIVLLVEVGLAAIPAGIILGIAYLLVTGAFIGFLVS